MAGMFSLLGILFGQPLTEVLKPLQVSDVLVDALLKNEGDLGRLLQAIDASERGDAEALAALLGQMQLPTAEFNSINIESHRWMLGVIKENEGGARA